MCSVIIVYMANMPPMLSVLTFESPICDRNVVSLQMWAILFYPVFAFFTFVAPALANVLFLPRGQIYASFHHWDLHFPIETRTSWVFAQDLQHGIDVFKSKFTSRFAEHRPKLFSDLKKRLWKKFTHNTDLLDKEMNLTIDTLQLLDPSHPTRVKRALLPFVGDALSSLFGTATTTEIQDILSRVNELDSSRNDFVNVIDSTVTMVNQTIVDVSVNRQTINRLTNVTDLLSDKYADSYTVAMLEIEMESMFDDLILTTRDFRRAVLNLETILSLAENGILPRSLVPPSRLTKILTEIQKKLPLDLALPFPPSDTDSYFSVSHTQTMRTTGKISVLVTIPLISVKDQFRVYQIFNIPVPKSSGNRTLVANYETENVKYVALSEDSMRFMSINDVDIQLYLRRRIPFCPIRRPIMNVLTSTGCIPALLTNRTDAVTRFCEHVIRINQTTDPTAEYLGNGHWIVVSVEPLDVEIRCKTGATVNFTETVKIVTPLSLIKLDFGCAAFNSRFQLPTHYRTDSYLEPYQIRHLNQTLKVNDVWDRVNAAFPDNLDDFVKTLPPTHPNTITLSALKQRIDSWKYQARYHSTVTIPVVSVTTVAFVVVCVLLIKCTRCPASTLSRVLGRVLSRPYPVASGQTVDSTTNDSTETTAQHSASQALNTVTQRPDASPASTPSPLSRGLCGTLAPCTSERS